MNSSTDASRLIFIGGSPRSGTTLIQNVLDTHRDVFGGPEFLHIPDIIALRNKLHQSISREWISLICTYEEVDSHIRSLIMEFLLPFADKYGGKLLSEKTPENVLVFPELVKLFPESRFVHVIRDPRAIVASLLSVGQRARKKGEKPASYTKDTQTAIQYAKRCLNAGFKATRDAPSRIHTVVYERFVQDPEGEAKKLCNHLGLDWDIGMLKPAEKKHFGEAAITVKSKEIWYDSKTYYSNPNTDSLYKWRMTLSPVQLVAIHQAFQELKEINQFGYDLSIEETSIFSKLQFFIFYGLNRLQAKFANRIKKLISSNA